MSFILLSAMRLPRFGIVALATFLIVVILNVDVRFPSRLLGRGLDWQLIQPSQVLAQTTQQRNSETLQLYQQGVEQYNQGQWQEALEIFQQVLGLVRASGNQQDEGVILNYIGLLYNNLGQYTEALKFSEQALQIAKELGNNSEEGKNLNNIGLVYLNLGQYPQALEFFEEALLIATEIRDRALQGVILNNIAEVYNSQSEYAKALSIYQQNLVIHQELGNQPMQGTTLNNIGLVYLNLGQYPQALEFFEEALLIAREIRDRALQGVILNNIAEVYNSQSEYAKALSIYQQALVIHQEVGNRRQQVITLNNIGLVYRNLSQYPQALEFLENAVVIAKEIGSRAEEGIILNGIAVVYSSLGNYAKAWEIYQQALRIHQEVRNRREEATTLNNIGGFYLNIGQDSKAINFFQEALAIKKEIGDQVGEWQALNNIGICYQILGQSSQALEFHQQALAICKEIGDKAGEAGILVNIGGVYDTVGQYPQSLKFYEQALVIVKEIGDKELEAKTLNNIGFVYRNLGNYSQALIFYDKSLIIAQKLGNKEGEAKTLNNIGTVYMVLGDYNNAEQVLLSAIEAWESLRSGLTDINKISIFEMQDDTYRYLQQVLIAQEKSNDALEIAERSRARALVELIASRLSFDKTAECQGTINCTPITPPKISQIQKIAREQKATLVQYSVLFDEEIFIWVIQPTGEIVFRRSDLKSLDTTLTDLVYISRNSIGVRGRGGGIAVSLDDSNPTQKLRQLHQLLIEPIADLLPPDPNAPVIFLPQESLFLVPFPALQDASGQSLIEQHTILTAPAIQILDLTHEIGTRNRNQDIGNTLIVGNPTMPKVVLKIGEPPQQLSSLPGAEKEAQEIAQLLKTNALIGNQATKTAVVEQMKNARIIHLATHGLLDDFKGLGIPGAIVLAPNPTSSLTQREEIRGNGLLTADEIFDLKLNAELVVLSACDTGRGRVTGDGVIGLSRSLISAGVPSVMVSLWSVSDDSTAFLMTEFYKNLQQNIDKAQALRLAMLKTKERYPNPLYWAAFTLIGESE